MRDSAGIAIVENAAPAWNAGAQWVLDPDPLVEIGAESGAEEYLLTGVAGVAVFEGGPIVVANRGFQQTPGPTGIILGTNQRGDNTLRFYDLSGKFLQRAGGDGEGPGEFREISSLVRHGSELWATQRLGRPANVFDRNGSFIRSVDARAGSASPGRIAGVFQGGTAVIEYSTLRQPPPGVILGSSIRITTRAPAGVIDTVLEMEGPRRLGQKTGFAVSEPYGPAPRIAVGARALYAAVSTEPEVRVFDESGVHVRTIRWNVERVRVTEADREAYRTRLRESDLARGNRFTRQDPEDVIATLSFGEYQPIFSTLFADEVGNLWVIGNFAAFPAEGHSRDGLFPARPATVFDSTGTWLGTVTLPAGFQPRVIGNDHVTGVWWDENRIERVRMYRLRKGAR